MAYANMTVRDRYDRALVCLGIVEQINNEAVFFGDLNDEQQDSGTFAVIEYMRFRSEILTDLNAAGLLS